MIKSSCPEVFYTKGVIKNFEKTHRKTNVSESQF